MVRFRGSIRGAAPARVAAACERVVWDACFAGPAALQKTKSHLASVGASFRDFCAKAGGAADKAYAAGANDGAAEIEAFVTARQPDLQDSLEKRCLAPFVAALAQSTTGVNPRARLERRG